MQAPTAVCPRNKWQTFRGGNDYYILSMEEAAGVTDRAKIDRKTKMGARLIFVVSWLLAAGAGAAEQVSLSAITFSRMPSYTLRSWQIDEGLPFDDIRDLLQRKNGYLWIATLSGLARFDGLVFETFSSSTAEGLCSNKARSLFEDRDQRLWIGHDNGSITMRQGTAFIPVSLPREWPDQPVAGFIQKTDGSVWAVNARGDMVDTAPGGRLYPATADFTEVTVAGDRILANGGNNAFLFSPESIPEAAEIKTIRNRNDRLILGGNQRLWQLSDNRLSACEGADQTADRISLPWQDQNDTQVLQCSDGTLILGSAFTGVMIIDPKGSRSEVMRDAVLPANCVQCLYEDREGTVWIGTNKGLCSVRRNKIGHILTCNDWAGQTPWSIIPASSGGVWLGTRGRRLYQVDKENVTQYLNPNLPMYVHLGTEDPSGALWVSTFRSQLFRLSGNQLERIPLPKECIEYVHPMCWDRNQTLWLGWRDGVWCRQNGSWKNPLPEGHGLTDITAICEGSDGAIWIGTASSGLAKWADGRLTHFNSSEGLPSESIRCLYFDKENEALWIGTSSGGLAFHRNGCITSVPTASGINARVIAQILEDRRGRLWLVSDQGVLVAEKTQLLEVAATPGRHIRPILFDHETELALQSIGQRFHGAVSTDGDIYFITKKGMAIIDPTEIERSAFAVPAHISQLSFGETVIRTDEGSRYTLPAGTRQVSIAFTGLSFVLPERLQFRYRLKNHENQWIEIGETRSLALRNMLPGSYHMELQARTSDGPWSDRTGTLDFVIRAYYYETAWFKTAVVLLAVFTAVMFALYIARQVHDRKLAEAEKLRAVEQERSRISMDLHDEIGAGLTRMTLLSELVQEDYADGRDAADDDRPVDRLLSQTRRLVNSLDEVVWTITPDNDRLSSLCDYLGKYAENYMRDAGIRCRLDIPFDLPEWIIPGPVRHDIFLITREIMNNVVKHAEATVVDFRFLLEKEGLTMIIKDNGVGFSGEADERFHRGIAGIRQRTEKYQGTMDVTSSPGEGTALNIHFPRKSIQL